MKYKPIKSQRKPKDVSPFAAALEQLMVTRVVQCVTPNSRDQLFELNPFILDDGTNESMKTGLVAASISAAFTHRLFLDVLDEVSAVLSLSVRIEKKT